MESSLLQDSNQAIKRGQRVAKCLIEICLYLFSMNENQRSTSSLKITNMDIQFDTFVSAAHLLKAFKSKLWHDSQFVSKQLPKIGNVLSATLVESGLDSFDKLLSANPRDIEFFLKRNPPFGSYLMDEVCV